MIARRAGRVKRVRTARQALAFLRRNGVLLVSGRGAVPTLVEYIAGEPIRGSWWGHPASAAIFRVLNAVAASPDVRMLRLVQGKVTLVHRNIWPALVRLAKHFPREALDAVTQEHTPAGKHRTVRAPFPRWVPKEIRDEGRRIAEGAAWALLPAVLRPPEGGPILPKPRRKPRTQRA